MCRGCEWAWNRRKLHTANCRERTRGNLDANCASTNSCARVDHHWVGTPYAGQHHGGNRARGLARHGLSPVHVEYAGGGEPRYTSRYRKQDECYPTSIAFICGQRKTSMLVPISPPGCTYIACVGQPLSVSGGLPSGEPGAIGWCGVHAICRRSRVFHRRDIIRAASRTILNTRCRDSDGRSFSTPQDPHYASRRAPIACGLGC